jgi:uncharacterized membrane protein
MADNPLRSIPDGSTSADVVRDQDKIMLVLAYSHILALFPLLTVKDSEYVRWHAKQGLALVIVLTVASLVLFFIPIINLAAACMLPVGYLALVIFAIIQAFKPVRWRIPGVSSLAEKF